MASNMLNRRIPQKVFQKKDYDLNAEICWEIADQRWLRVEVRIKIRASSSKFMRFCGIRTAVTLVQRTATRTQ